MDLSYLCGTVAVQSTTRTLFVFLLAWLCSRPLSYSRPSTHHSYLKSSSCICGRSSPPMLRRMFRAAARLWPLVPLTAARIALPSTPLSFAMAAPRSGEKDFVAIGRRATSAPRVPRPGRCRLAALLTGLLLNYPRNMGLAWLAITPRNGPTTVGPLAGSFGSLEGCQICCFRAEGTDIGRFNDQFDAARRETNIFMAPEVPAEFLNRHGAGSTGCDPERRGHETNNPLQTPERTDLDKSRTRPSRAASLTHTIVHT